MAAISVAHHSAHIDYSPTAPSKRDQEIAAEAKQRARDQHHYLRSDLRGPLRGIEVIGGAQDLKGGAASGVGGVISHSDPKHKTLNPPENFSKVSAGIYRSGFPKPENFEHLGSLRLKTVLTLVPEEYPEPNAAFIIENSIQHFQIGMPGNKEPFVKIPPRDIAAALSVVLDRRNHPLLIHCNKGKHRTGCVVGCFRKIQNWALASIFVEYHHHASPKSRMLDERFIELFDERALLPLARDNGYVPMTVARSLASPGFDPQETSGQRSDPSASYQNKE
ncbi:MAG: hypothetical protein M1827_002895 [Pycnora praestabilis]|nr:MAG: hypothetical protein M1827_002895 [Pycnora praestabilis]